MSKVSKLPKIQRSSTKLICFHMTAFATNDYHVISKYYHQDWRCALLYWRIQNTIPVILRRLSSQRPTTINRACSRSYSSLRYRSQGDRIWLSPMFPLPPCRPFLAPHSLRHVWFPPRWRSWRAIHQRDFPRPEIWPKRLWSRGETRNQGWQVKGARHSF